MKPSRSLGAAIVIGGLLLPAATGPRAQSDAMSQRVAYASGTWLADGALLVAGGLTANGVSDQAVRVVWGQASASTPLLVRRAEHTGTLLPDGTVAIAGGRDSRGSLDSVEVLSSGASTLLTTRLTRRVNGHATTLLPDGRLFVTGGRDEVGRLLTSAQALDLNAGHAVELIDLARRRAAHTVTMLTNGAVFVAGGQNGVAAIDEAELWLPGATSVLSARLQQPRSGHTATLLPDGTVLLTGGLNVRAQPIASLERFDPTTSTFVSATAQLAVARAHHFAVLLPTGQVLIHGGIDAGGQLIADAELYDPATDRMRPAPSLSASTLRAPRTASIVESSPASNATDVPTTVRVAVRFSEPVAVTSVTRTTVQLVSGRTTTGVNPIPVEGGLLLFVTPVTPLQPGTQYTLVLDGLLTTTGARLPATSLNFTTAGLSVTAQAQPTPQGQRRSTGATVLSDPDEDDPGMLIDARSRRKISKWQDLPSLQAPPGVTAVAGQVLQLNGKPLAGVTLEVEGKRATSDATGRFLVTHVEPGPQVLVIDGRSANRRGATYGVFEVGVTLVPGETMPLGYSIWMPKIDVANAVRIASPTTAETVISSPHLPGLSIHLPPGTIVRNRDGSIATEVSITPVPLDRPPFPTPDGITFAMYFTVQPGGASLESMSSEPGSRGAWVVYPNATESPAGVETDFWHYEAQGAVGWYRYGRGRVSEDARWVMPLEHTRLYKFSMFTYPVPIWPGAATVGPTPTDNAEDGEPVDLATGLFVQSKTDLLISDVIPIMVERTYRPQDPNTWSFGKGTALLYDMHLFGESYTRISLVRPDGARIAFNMISGTSLLNGLYEHSESPSRFYKAQLHAEGSPYGPTWLMTLLDGSKYLFNWNGRLLSIKDRFGNTVSLTREFQNLAGYGNGPWGRILRITSPSGRFIDLAYDAQERITAATDSIGRTVTYTYDGQGRLATTRDANSGLSEYTYDSAHRMLTLKDARGIIYLTNQYYGPGPHEGRVQRQTQADSTIFEFAYTNDGAGRIIQADVTNPRGHVRRVTFDSAGYPLTDTRALGQPEQQTVTYTRQTGTNFVQTTTDALGRQTSSAYDPQGNVQSVTRLTGTSQAVTTTFTYEPPGTGFNRLTSVTTPITTTTLAYNDPSRQITVTDPLTHQTVITHNVRGQVTTITNPLSHTTTLEYDGQGNLTAVQDPLGNRMTRGYDAVGRLMNQADPAGRTTTFLYDALNHIKVVADPRGGTTRFSYDANGNLLSVTDARGNTTSYQYSSMDRVIAVTDPLSKAETYVYDSNGNITSITDRRNQTTTQTYDALNRRATRTFADSSTIVYTWDAGNRLAQVADSLSGTITRTYHPLNMVLTETTPLGTVAYTYDSAARRATMAVPGTATITYTYDVADRLTTITQGSNVLTLEYDNANRRTKLTYPSGTVTEYSYDNVSRVTGLTYKYGTSTLGALTYGYDGVSRRTQVGGAWARTSLPQAIAGATYDSANRLITYGTATLTYDDNGNLTSDATNTYTWDARNRLSMITGPTAASFTYDALGRRRQKTVSGVTTTFVYDGLNPVRMTAGSATVDLLTGLRIDEFFARSANSTTEDLLSDALGSTLAIADASGTVVGEYNYEPFGRVTVSGTGGDNALRFTGREDDGTPLVYYRARYYHPVLQRFISQDPAGFSAGDPNLYAYVRNRPVIATDPLGLWGPEHHGAIAEEEARACGMSDEEVAALAAATKAPDFLFWRVPSFSTLNPWSAKHGMPNSDWRGYVERKLTQAGTTANSADALRLLGQGLHALQDAFAHDLAGVGMLAHAGPLIGGVNPDDATAPENLARAAAARRETRNAIRDYMRSRGQKPTCAAAPEPE